MSPLEIRPPGHQAQPPRSPGPSSSRLGVCQPFSPPGFIPVGHPFTFFSSVPDWGIYSPMRSRRRLPATSTGDSGGEFCQFHPCRPPLPSVTPHHLRDARQRHCFPPGHPLLSQLFIREPLITTITFIDAVSPQRSRFVYMGYI